jgi:dTDP-4-amino-4,6-dideoxygalactose transaminase
MLHVPLFKVRMPERAAQVVGEALGGGQLSGGATVDAFEGALGKFIGNPLALATCDGPAALTLALACAGVRPGDEVLVSPLSCLSTTAPIANLAAQPVWCDVDPSTGMLDPSRLPAHPGPRARAVLAYHWSGDPADLDGVRAYADHHGIAALDDASEALGARWRGRQLGATAMDFTVLSFHAVKHVTTIDGGALLCRREADLSRARRLRRFGIDSATFRLPNGDLDPSSNVAEVGWSFGMNSVAAALGQLQLADAEAAIARHRENGAWFDRALGGIPGLTLLARTPHAASSFWTYALRAERRDDLVRMLHSKGIGAQRLHVRNDAYSGFAAARAAGALAGVEIFDRENLAIPCGWWVDAEKREAIASCIRAGW